MLTIAIDAMGGDHGPSVTVPAALNVLAKYPSLNLILVGDESILQKHLSTSAYDSKRLTIHHASQQVEMNEPPSSALRTKKDSSMRVAINLVKEGEASACVSAGNTGALMATARFVLQCQSCLEPFSYEIMSDFVLGIVNTLDEANALPERYEPALAHDGSLTLREMIEDEIILNLPIIPRHEPEDCKVKLPLKDAGWEQGKGENPFRVLESLKHKKDNPQ